MPIVFTIAGFFIAFLVNLLFPQKADIIINEYVIGNVSWNMNILYRCFLLTLVTVYLVNGVISFRNKKRKKYYIHRAPFRFAMGIALAVWDVGGTKLQVFPQPFFPGPAGIAEAFLQESEYIWENMVYSLRLFVVGFVIGVIVGIATGILIGWFPKVNYWLSPVLNISGIIPAVAWMPFALILFPTSFAAAAFLLAISTWFPVASMTALGISSTPKAQFEAAKTLGAKSNALIFHVAVPHAMPQIFVGITTAEAYVFATLVMAEMMGQPGGLGYYINASKVWSAYYKVFAAIIVMAVLFSLISKAIEFLQKRILKWQKGIVK